MIFTLFVPGTVWTSNAQRKMHHFAQAELVKDIRTATKLLALNWLRSGGAAFTTPVEVGFVPHQRNRGVLADTAAHHPACKAVLDGLVDAGVIVDDTPAYVISQRYYPPIKAKTSGVLVMLNEATDESR